MQVVTKLLDFDHVEFARAGAEATSSIDLEAGASAGEGTGVCEALLQRMAFGLCMGEQAGRPRSPPAPALAQKVPVRPLWPPPPPLAQAP